MTKRNNLVFIGLQIVSWIIFVGLCIEAGALIVNFVYSLFKPEIVHNLYQKLDIVFSMRHHTNSFALLNHVPTFGYDIYPKIRAFFEQMGHNDMLLDPFEANLSETFKKIDTVIQQRESISQQLKSSLALLRNRMSTALDVALNHR